MNRKITNTMAKDASSLMKEKAYGQKVENARAKVNAAVEELIRKYIPAPVIACVNEYSTYFACAQYASITTVVSIDGLNKTLRAIDGTLTFKIPTVANYVKVANCEYDALCKLYNQRQLIEQERDKFGDQVYEALIALRTEKAVERELPEAMKYLEFPIVKALPMPILKDLRDIIGSL